MFEEILEALKGIFESTLPATIAVADMMLTILLCFYFLSPLPLLIFPASLCLIAWHYSKIYAAHTQAELKPFYVSQELQDQRTEEYCSLFGKKADDTPTS